MQLMFERIIAADYAPITHVGFAPPALHCLTDMPEWANVGKHVCRLAAAEPEVNLCSACVVPSILTGVQVSEACQDLLRRMMTSDPKNRISVQARHPATHGQHMAVVRQTPCLSALLHAVHMLMVFRCRGVCCCRASCSTPGSCTTCRQARWTSTPSSSPPTQSGAPPAALCSVTCCANAFWSSGRAASVGLQIPQCSMHVSGAKHEQCALCRVQVQQLQADVAGDTGAGERVQCAARQRQAPRDRHQVSRGPRAAAGAPPPPAANCAAGARLMSPVSASSGCLHVRHQPRPPALHHASCMQFLPPSARLAVQRDYHLCSSVVDLSVLIRHGGPVLCRCGQHRRAQRAEGLPLVCCRKLATMAAGAGAPGRHSGSSTNSNNSNQTSIQGPAY